MSDRNRRLEVEQQVQELFELAVKDGSLASGSRPADVEEVFQNLCELYLGDMDAESLKHARACFEAAFAQLKSQAANGKGGAEAATRKLRKVMDRGAWNDAIEEIVGLVAQGADVALTNRHGGNVVHVILSVCLQHKFDVRPLDAVLAAGADINLAGKTGITPIDIALAFGNFDVAQLLIDRGADPEPTRQRAAKKPQELSDSGGKPEAIAWQQRVMALGRK